tara:strand:+ start:283 stop:555 length:273 start_codon:yes stop_codon:yes gene_type:complete
LIIPRRSNTHVDAKQIATRALQNFAILAHKKSFDRNMRNAMLLPLSLLMLLRLLLLSLSLLARSPALSAAIAIAIVETSVGARLSASLRA